MKQALRKLGHDSLKPPLKAEHDSDLISPYKRGGAGSNPAAPTKFLQLNGLFETLIGDPVNHSREPPVHHPWYGKGIPGLRQQGARHIWRMFQDVLQEGAEVMDRLFGGVNSGLAE